MLKNLFRKNIKNKVFIFGVIVLFNIKIITVSATEEYIDYYDFSAVNEIINNEVTYEEIDFAEIIKELMKGESDNVIGNSISIVFSNAVAEVKVGYTSLLKIIMLAIITALLSNFSDIFNQGAVSETAYYITYLILASLLMTAFQAVIIIAEDILLFLTEFMTALIPAYFLSVGVVGSTSAIAFYEFSLIIITLVQIVLQNFILPLIRLYILVAVINNISKRDYLSKFTQLIKKICTTTQKTLLTVVLSINVIQALVLPSVDNVKNNGFVKIISVIPGIGNTAGTISDILLSSGILIKNCIGTGAIIVILVICGIPLLKIGIFSFMYQIAAAVVQPVSDKRVVKSISEIVTGINMLFECCKTACMLFVITIAIICISTNVG